jgi:phospholipase/carboxylesterase
MPKMARVTRRRFGIKAGSAVGALAFTDACVVATRSADRDARLTARPITDMTTTLKSGAIGLGSNGRDGIIQMPTTPKPGLLPLLLFLHGATQDGARMVRRVGPAADDASIVLVCPDSRDVTWDAIRGGFGDDVAHLNRVLEYVFAHVAVDPDRVIVGGFSDGATYALSLGLANGDLFPRVAAFSPGFVIPVPVHGRPRFFVSHGRSDPILPIDQCSRIIVPQLRAKGYDVTFKEFDGRHEVPPDVASDAMRWMTT